VPPPTDAKLGKLETALTVLARSPSELVPPLPLCSYCLLTSATYQLTLTPQQQNQKTLETLLAVLMALTAAQPVVNILEGIHWIDPSTLELLSVPVNQAATRGLFTLFSCRPTFRPPWTPHAHLTHLTLSRLSSHQAALMITQVAGASRYQRKCTSDD
jgi:predicted ATPase